MELRPDMTIGQRLAVARRYTGLTQEALAERAGVNVDTIRKLEQGQRQSARVSTANALATALGITTTELLLGVVPQVERGDDPQLLAIRRALVPAGDWLPAVDVEGEDAPPDIEALRESVADAWSSYHGGDFATLGRTVPDLLTEARVAVRENTNSRAAAASAVLAKTSQLAAHVLVQHGQEDLALLGLDRAAAAARDSDDAMLPAMITNSVSWIFLRTGRLDDSEQVATRAADTIEPKFRSDRHQVSVYGGLLLSGMTAAARAERYDTARELLRVAQAAAQMVGDSTDRWTSVFGPTSVSMQAVQLETTAGEWGKALELARRVPMAAQTPESWRARFMLDVAHAQTETHRDTAAVETLQTIRRLAPGWLRQHGLARAVVRELMMRPTRPRGVVAMADFVGVPH
ncbi:helix-turn-helix domain-containing protein [Streptosporangium sp. G11]|uniref:helix-turn-helix domain-containing protein n=1 Tax=Streptosporangium sp. G11 TaxID=3436926 RepID=UPI003EB97315